MTDGINSIKFNAASINGSNVSGEKASDSKEKKDDLTPQQQVQSKEVSEKTYKDFNLAQTNYAIANLNMNSQKTIEYYTNLLTPAQKAEIANNISQIFEPGVIAWGKICEEELGAAFTNLPEAEQNALAAAAFANNDDE